MLGAGFDIRAADDESGKLVVSEVLSSASDVLRSLMNAGLYPTSITESNIYLVNTTSAISDRCTLLLQIGTMSVDILCFG